MVSYNSGDLLTGIVPSNMTAAISITDGDALLGLLGTGKPVTVASDTGLPVRSRVQQQIGLWVRSVLGLRAGSQLVTNQIHRDQQRQQAQQQYQQQLPRRP